MRGFDKKKLNIGYFYTRQPVQKNELLNQMVIQKNTVFSKHEVDNEKQTDI